MGYDTNFAGILPEFAEILFGSQEVQKMNMKMEIRKKENGYDTKRNILRKIILRSRK